MLLCGALAGAGGAAAAEGVLNDRPAGAILWGRLCVRLLMILVLYLPLPMASLRLSCRLPALPSTLGGATLYK